MVVLKKAVLIDYTKLKTMIEQGTIDNETVYFLSGKDLHDKIMVYNDTNYTFIDNTNFLFTIMKSIPKLNLKPIKLLFLI